MSEKLHGVIRGKIIELREPVALPDGTEVEIAIVEELYKDAWNRQIELMKQGFPMGKRLSINRDELHD